MDKETATRSDFEAWYFPEGAPVHAREKQGVHYKFIAAQVAWEIWQTATQKANQWRPIADAPRDGTFIVASGCYPHSGAPETVRWYEDEWDAGGNCLIEEPTHFMPLPPTGTGGNHG